VREVITGLVSAHPALASQLLAADGDLNRFVNAFLNDTDVRHLQALETPVADGDTLVLLPAMAGGCSALGDAGGWVGRPPRPRSVRVEDLREGQPP
jgi:molybdopterin synthase sulfur carrier subunit